MPEREGDDAAAVQNGVSPGDIKLASGKGDLQMACEGAFRDLCRLAQVGGSCWHYQKAAIKPQKPCNNMVASLH